MVLGYQVKKFNGLNNPLTECSVVWLAHLIWDQEIVGSNPTTPIYIRNNSMGDCDAGHAAPSNDNEGLLKKMLVRVRLSDINFTHIAQQVVALDF